MVSLIFLRIIQSYKTTYAIAVWPSSQHQSVMFVHYLQECKELAASAKKDSAQSGNNLLSTNSSQETQNIPSICDYYNSYDTSEW